MAIKNSIKEYTRAKKILVGGVNSPVRAFQSVKGNPLFIDHGKGKKIYDLDGNGYTDYCLSWGALILGHAHPDVMRAVVKGLKRAVSFGTSTKPEVDIAEFIVKHVPSVDMIRFVNSGTEATMSAIRLARGFTGRDLVVKFDGCYHGHVDDLLTTAGSGVANLQASSSKGIPLSHIQNTLSLPYNDSEKLSQTFHKHGKKIACVIIEPVAGNMGVVVPDSKFLKLLREVTRKNESVLIFDEVMTGFRTNLGCVQSDFGIYPDMTCFGKIIGGGFPVGAYGGRKDIMKCLSPSGGVYQAGTFAGNPIVMRAGLATLKNLNKKLFSRLNALGDSFAETLNDELARKNLKMRISHFKSMISIRFNSGDVKNYAEAQSAGSNEAYSKLFHMVLSHGIYLPPADLESFFISSAHDDRDMKKLAGHLLSAEAVNGS